MAVIYDDPRSPRSPREQLDSINLVVLRSPRSRSSRISEDFNKEYIDIRLRRCGLFVFVTMFLLMYLASISMCVIGFIVISDYKETTFFTEKICSGDNLTNLVIESGPTSYHGTAQTCVVDLNNTCIYNVELFYPPIYTWELIGETGSDVLSWAERLSSNKTFICYIDSTSGISDLFDRIGTYLALTMVAIMIFMFFSYCGYKHKYLLHP